MIRINLLRPKTPDPLASRRLSAQEIARLYNRVPVGMRRSTRTSCQDVEEITLAIERELLESVARERTP